jgi:uncharacterized membrane protein HdeD (DUF308 family)
MKSGDIWAKLVGPILIVFGLLILGLWFYPLYIIEGAFSEEYPPSTSAIIIKTLRDTPRDFFRTPWSFVAVVGLVLIGIGISCLVHSFRKSRQ